MVGIPRRAMVANRTLPAPELLTSCGQLQTSLTGEQEGRSQDGGDSTARDGWQSVAFPLLIS